MWKKTGKQTSDVAVQGTNDNSIGSKFSMSNLGYFADDFVKYFAGRQCRRSPIINRGYYIRAAAVNHCLVTFINTFAECRTQIVNLGAGSDASYFRLQSSNCLTNTSYVEVDFRELLAKKCRIIVSEPQLLEMIGKPAEILQCSDEARNCIVLNTENLKLLGVDLCRPDLIRAALEAVGVDFSFPTLILSEVVLTYLSPARSSDVISWASKTFTNSIFVCYEQVHPSDAFGIFMCRHFESLGSPLRTVHSYPTVASQVNRCIGQGWSCVVASDMNYFYNFVVSEDERSRVELLEPFDEYEEWHLKCAHYVLLTAFNGSCQHLASIMWPQGFSHLVEIRGDIFTSESLRSADARSGTFIAVTKQSSTSANADRFVSQNSYEVREPASSDGSKSTYSEMQSNQSWVLQNSNCRLSLGTCAMCRHGTRWKAAELTFVGDETDLRCQRFGHTADVLVINGERRVVTVGGFGVASCGRHRRLADIAAWSLSALTPDIYSLDSAAGPLLSRMCHATAVLGNTVLGNHTPGNPSLVVVGGRYSPASGVCEYLLSVDFGNSLSADSVTCRSVVCSGDIPDSCWRHTVVHAIIDGVDCLIQFGGRSRSHTACNDCYMLNCTSCVWNKVFPGGEVPEARHSHSADMWSGYMVVAGGLGSDFRPLSSVHSLDVRLMRWKCLQVQSPLVPRYSHTSAVYKDYLILVGGVSLSCLSPPVEMIHLVTGHAETLELPATVGSQLAMLHHHASVLLDNEEVITTDILHQTNNNSAAAAAADDDGDDDASGDRVRLLIVGGGGNCFSFGTHFNRHLMMLTIHSARLSGACNSTDAVS